MSKILLRDRPDPIPPTVYEEEFIKGYELRNPEVTTGYLAVSGSYANTSGYITVSSSTIASMGSGLLICPLAYSSTSASGWYIS